MIGKGPKHERETVITFNEIDTTAQIWTASEVVYRKLKKNGYFPVNESDRSASFEVPRRQIRLPKPPSQARIDAGKRLASRLPGTPAPKLPE